MRSSRMKAAAALLAAAALSLAAACGGSSNSGGGGSSSAPKLNNKALDAVANPSDAKGGTLKMAMAGPWGDSFDPGDTYYGYSWNLVRNYTRSLVMFKPAPGKGGLQLVPDMATSLGKSSDGGKTWTYTIQSGLKMEDGTPITSKLIAYGVERTFDRAVLKQGPSYFHDLLDWPASYKGPYKSGANADVSSAIQTPNDTTIVFHLKQPFAEFDYLAQLPQTAPVEPSKDTGTKYTNHPVSSGPYMWKGNVAIATGGTLVRNPNWSASTDPNRKALPDEIDVKLGLEAADLDNQLISGDQQVDIAALGVGSAALPKVLSQKDLADRADNPVGSRLWYTSIPSTVKPLDNIECRKAVMYAMAPVSYVNAYGGKYAGGDIATQILPPSIPGYEKSDTYGLASHPNGQASKAKAALKACGQPNGFSTNIGYRSDRPAEEKTAEAFQQALGKVGIKLTLKPLSDDTYFSETCGKPSYVVANNLGLCTNGWAADWNTSYGFLAQIVDSRVINPQGGSSNVSVRLPAVDKLVDNMGTAPNADQRASDGTQIDKQVMDSALIYPGIVSKTVLLRGTNLTNVFINDAYSGEYDYTALGVKK
jgi:peptide/nickel transport system substrate-binding protein